MLNQNKVALPPTRQAAGVSADSPGGIFGETLVSRFTPEFYSMVKSGLVYQVSGVATNPAAFTGGAAGTPLVGLYNPSNSGKDLALISVVIGIRTTGSAAAAIDFNHWGVAQGSTAVTGTQTQARNLYTMLATGSAAYAMSNTANTAALASNLLRPGASVGLTGLTAAPNVSVLVDRMEGLIVIPPGGYYAFGASAAPTAASIDYAAIWAELPV